MKNPYAGSDGGMGVALRALCAGMYGAPDDDNLLEDAVTVVVQEAVREHGVEGLVFLAVALTLHYMTETSA
jgi:hypothetical protein